MRKVDGWLAQPLAAGRISADKIVQAKQLIDTHRPHIQPAFQHGDFVPWHLFAINGQQLVLFDGEHASLVKPRFYDLAYLYSRLYTRSQAPASARKILSGYIEQAGHNPDHFAHAFLPVITLRALGMHADAYADRQHFDYAPAARDLLDRCLSRDLQALTA
jgi:aminoglycoside phosphotransferase (APT) family kinase protein